MQISSLELNENPDGFLLSLDMISVGISWPQGLVQAHQNFQEHSKCQDQAYRCQWPFSDHVSATQSHFP